MVAGPSAGATRVFGEQPSAGDTKRWLPYIRNELLPIIRTEKSETRLWGVFLCIHALGFRGSVPFTWQTLSCLRLT
ncbi:hypothetical protein BUE64_10860 [Corynebacterium diphtheriae subsp. lausannense]|nr:hypothetical protein BUE64_10860 [Corynebacterium diphtheriae subsp. lausannense]